MSDKALKYVENELRGAEGNALAMWQLLADCADDRGVIKMSQKEIAEHGGVHFNTVKKYVNRWVESGALGRIKSYSSGGNGKIKREADTLIITPFDKPRTPMGRVPKEYQSKLVNPWA